MIVAPDYPEWIDKGAWGSTRVWTWCCRFEGLFWSLVQKGVDPFTTPRREVRLSYTRAMVPLSSEWNRVLFRQCADPEEASALVEHIKANLSVYAVAGVL